MSGLGTFAIFFGGDPDQVTPEPPYLYRTASGEVPEGRVYLTFGGERLDQVALEAYGFQIGAVEALLVWNPGLADQPYHLPKNLAIELPELIGATDARNPREVALWS